MADPQTVTDDAEPASVPLGGTRSEAMQRLQVGVAGIGAMILLVGLANVLQNRAELSEAMSVPDAAPTTEPSAPPPQRDPLADAGLVPDMPAEAVPEEQEPAILPEQGLAPDQGPESNRGDPVEPR
ncbi:MAG: hypothetical protein ABJ239_02510 [Erythrobacter sp.]